uniref:Pink-eyed dilution-like 2 n=1 Tax=Savillea parva TaxID=1909275 RepID=A0A1D8RAI2_9EUKA|nr:pink-eyed dilution-like 2 [Savillea parva]|eukprot:m.68048 g.68048  ORF g.68048 m.68048 type:complete len:770 (-) comp8486_c1_seq1:289-2598(-)
MGRHGAEKVPLLPDGARSPQSVDYRSRASPTSTMEDGVRGDYDRNYLEVVPSQQIKNGKKLENMTGWQKFKYHVMLMAGNIWGRKLRTIVLFLMLIIPAIAFAMEAEKCGAPGGHGPEDQDVEDPCSELLPLSAGAVPGEAPPATNVTISAGYAFKFTEVTLLYKPSSSSSLDGINPNLTVTVSGCIVGGQDFDVWTIDGNPRAGVGPEYHKMYKGCGGSECNMAGCTFSIAMESNSYEDDLFNPVAIEFAYHGLAQAVEYEVLFAGLILAFVYFLIITELIHRTVAAMLGSFITLGVLSALNKRPPLSTIVLWIDFETVMLLFGMMIIVGVLAETGAFEFAAVKAYKFSKGKVWPLLTMLVTFSAVVSAFLDNVTTILLLTPVTIRMCNVIGLDPTPILLAEVVFSNIGGTATAVGDPPNVIIVSSKWNEVPGEKDITFMDLTIHLFCGIIFVGFVCYAQLRFMYRNTIFNNPDSPMVAELKREISIWTRTLNRQPRTTREEKSFCSKLEAKINELEMLIEEAESTETESWAETVREMELDAQIKDWDLFYNTCLVLTVVILLFFLHSVPGIHLDLGWIAVIGAMSLLLICGIQNIEELMMKVEWATLLFFGALFILMEGLDELGLIQAIGHTTSDIIKDFPEESRKAWSIVLILWVSALASSFIDNIPFTAAMIPVIKSIASDPDVNVPMRPLVWSLAFGACLGGNGTLIGASANVVMAGLAEQEGISITFNRFFKLGFPIMLVSTTVAMFYLLFCHCILEWDDPIM